MIEFDDVEIGQCPKCHGVISPYCRYCPSCGGLLPLPPTAEGLDPQLELDNVELPCNHDEEDRRLNNELGDLRDNYCPKYGRKF